MAKLRFLLARTFSSKCPPTPPVECAGARESDPIQKLFLQATRDYKNLSVDGGLVDPTPEIEKELKDEIRGLDKKFSVSDENMTEFPKFQFKEPKIDPINLTDEKQKDGQNKNCK